MGKRDTFYFPHEYNAKDDPKCERLIWEMGMEGYGMFWTLIEVLRAQPDYTYPVANIPIIARKYNADASKMQHVVFDYGLFTIVEDRIFFSNGLTFRMRAMDERRRKLSEAGKRGNETRWNNTAVSGGDREAIALSSPPDRSKGDKSKGDNIKKLSNESKESADKPRSVASKRGAFVAPSLEELRVYVSEQGLTNVNPEEFIDYYTANGWRAGKNPMKDWRAAARNWNRRHTEFITNTKKPTNHEPKLYDDL